MFKPDPLQYFSCGAWQSACQARPPSIFQLRRLAECMFKPDPLQYFSCGAWSLNSSLQCFRAKLLDGELVVVGNTFPTCGSISILLSLSFARAVIISSDYPCKYCLLNWRISKYIGIINNDQKRFLKYRCESGIAISALRVT